MLTLETERTTLRPLTADDFDAVQRWASDPEAVKYMDWGPNTEADTRRFLSDCEKNRAAEPVKKYDFGIALNATGELIGACKIYLLDDLSTAEVGWILRRDHWKRGIATEAAGELLRFGFEALGLHRLFAICMADNYGSYRVMERSNMRREGHYVKGKRLHNAEPDIWVDVYQYAILEEEYFKS